MRRIVIVAALGLLLVLSAWARGPDGPTPPPDAWWPGDGDARDRIGDQDGTLVGPAGFGPGRICGAFDLDGAQAHVALGSSEIFDFVEGDFTVAFWARWRSLANEQVLIEKWDNGPFRGWTLTKLPNDRLRFACGHNGGEADLDVYPTDITTDRWFHVAVTRSTNLVTVYWDGVPLGSNWRATCDATPFPLLLGRRSDARGFFHNGRIDEVMVFRRALSEAEILALTTQAGTDADGDGICDEADNCPFDDNPAQSDFDGDGTGDPCDLDDGQIYVYCSDKDRIDWRQEIGPASWNLYEGDLDVLRATGEYTQVSGSNPLADRHCGLASSAVCADDACFTDDTIDPDPGTTKFALVTGVQDGTEWGLGLDSHGNVRPNANPCP